MSLWKRPALKKKLYYVDNNFKKENDLADSEYDTVFSAISELL